MCVHEDPLPTAAGGNNIKKLHDEGNALWQ